MLKFKNKELEQMIYTDYSREVMRLKEQFRSKSSSTADMAVKILDQEGKMIRPVLFYLLYLMFHDNFTKDMGKIALSIELIHNASLIHDDIMDQSLIRRNQKTIISEFGFDNALVLGDFLIFTAMQELNSVRGKEAGRIGRYLIQCGMELCCGQNKEKELLYRIDVEQDVYFQVIEMKTACFFKVIFQIAAILADGSGRMVEDFGDAGMELGYAFQIHNDIQDIMKADEKDQDSDIYRRLATLPVILAYQNGTQSIKDALRSYYVLGDKVERNFQPTHFSRIASTACDMHGGNNEYGDIKQLLQESGVPAAEAVMKRSLRTAYDILNDYGPNAALKEIKQIINSL